MKRQGVYIRLVSVLALGLFLGMGVLSCGAGGGGTPPPNYNSLLTGDTLPAGYSAVFYGGAIGNDLLGVSPLASSPYKWDVFMVKANTAYSLMQVTNTPTINEWPADW
jgi:hypothetical protein